jgi:hypothetical protein
MIKYLEKYPSQEQDIMTLATEIGFDEVEIVCKKALKENKIIQIINDEKKIDLLTYKLI